MVAKYNLEIRGFYNYYCIANNVSATCADFGYIMKYSLYKTLARKYNSSLRKIIRKYTKDKVFSIPYKDSKGNEKRRILYHDGFKRKTVGFHETCDNILFTHYPKRSLAERLRNNACEVCGGKGPLIMHHIRTLKSANKNTPWGKQMLLMSRKPLLYARNVLQESKRQSNRVFATGEPYIYMGTCTYGSGADMGKPAIGIWYGILCRAYKIASSYYSQK